MNWSAFWISSFLPFFERRPREDGSYNSFMYPEPVFQLVHIRKYMLGKKETYFGYQTDYMMILGAIIVVG